MSAASGCSVVSGLRKGLSGVLTVHRSRATASIPTPPTDERARCFHSTLRVAASSTMTTTTTTRSAVAAAAATPTTAATTIFHPRFHETRYVPLARIEMERRIKNNPEVKRRLSSLELDAAFHDIALAVRGANSEMMRDLSAAFSLLRRPQASTFTGSRSCIITIADWRRRNSTSRSPAMKPYLPTLSTRRKKKRSKRHC